MAQQKIGGWHSVAQLLKKNPLKPKKNKAKSKVDEILKLLKDKK
jgi:hypothetical protein